jgi:Protein of unknown function (DUF3800)
MTAINKTYLFIDESGDPAFYASGNRIIVGTEGFKPILLIGIVKLDDKKAIRNAIIQFMNELKSDPLYNSLPCINDPKGWYLHASYDNLEVRVKFTEFLRKLKGFEFYCVIGRKRLDIFHKKHNCNEITFYFDLVTHLIKDRLDNENTFYQILLSARKKSTPHKLKEAVENALQMDNSRREAPLKIKYNCEIVLSKETPELSIVDYLLWAIQRYLLKGSKRFFTALEAKYNLIIDLYNADGEKSKYYDINNRFDIEKAGEFKADGYVK